MDITGTAKRNLVLLTLAQSLGGASAPIIISLGGLIGQMLTPSPALATLPVSVYQLGVALGTIPAAIIMRQFGRRAGYLLGAAIGVTAALIATAGIVERMFLVFCLGTMTCGIYGSFIQSYRFAATDSVAPEARGQAISWVMVGGLVAAVIGPQIVIWTRDSLPGIPFAGSFLGQAALALLAIPVLAQLRAPPARTGTTGGGRPLAEIMRQPRFILAVLAGMVSFGLMSFVMTAAPMAMVDCGHTIGEAALGIQWHVLAMFAPSFATGWLIKRFGKEVITAAGLIILAASGGIALLGLELWHFWLSLILLGLGWNLGYIGATAMVGDCHTPAERTKVQGANDFLIFGSVAIASFSSGALLNSAGWAVINGLIFPLVSLVLLSMLFGRRSLVSRP